MNACVKVKSLLGATEARAYDELLDLLRHTEWRPWPKVRVGDVVEEPPHGPWRSLWFGGHFDFLLVSCKSLRPALAIELDGPHHNSDQQKSRDRAEDVLCASARLPLLRLPVQAADLREQETALAWTVEQFLAVSRNRAELRRSAIQAIERLSPDVRDVYVEMDGSAEATFDRHEEQAWISHRDARLRYPSLTSLAERLSERYALSPATFVEEQWCNLERDPNAAFLFFTDWTNPRVAGYYVFRTDDFRGGQLRLSPAGHRTLRRAEMRGGRTPRGSPRGALSRASDRRRLQESVYVLRP